MSFAYKYLWLSTNGILPSFNKKLIIRMQRAHPTSEVGNREALSLSTVECIVLLTLWFIILSCCLSAVTNGPLTIYCLTGLLFTQSGCNISEVPCSGTVSAHTICVPRPSPTEPHSGPHLTTKPGPAKRTVPEHGTERSHYLNEQSFGAQIWHGSKHPVWVHL